MFNPCRDEIKKEIKARLGISARSKVYTSLRNGGLEMTFSDSRVTEIEEIVTPIIEKHRWKRYDIHLDYIDNDKTMLFVRNNYDRNNFI